MRGDEAALDDRARRWLDRGGFYRWKPRAADTGREAQVFHVEAGPVDAPLLVLVHGWPTSSIDWIDVLDRLAEDHRVSALDFPGYGFSDKPSDWSYRLEIDAELLEHHIVDVLGRGRCRVVAHDRGDSVVLLLHHRSQRNEGTRDVELDHLVLSNGNVFLPLSNLTGFQRLLLDPARAADVQAALTPSALAGGLGMTTFTPARPPEDPTVVSLASTFAWCDGTSVMHRTIQYLRERAELETVWLQSLASSRVPTSVIWGLSDTVAPPRVAMHVWAHYLRDKPGQNELWVVPEANHYLQNDRPAAFAEVVRHTLEASGPQPPGPLGTDPDAPLRVDQSGPLPSSMDTLEV